MEQNTIIKQYNQSKPRAAAKPPTTKKGNNEMKNLTKDELRTLLWMCETTAARIALDDLHKGKNPSNNATHQRVLEISKKANNELVKRNNAE